MVKGIPTELVGDVVQLVLLLERGLVLAYQALGGRLGGDEGRVRTGGQDAIEPRLLVLVSGGRECCSRQLFGVETQRGFLG